MNRPFWLDIVMILPTGLFLCGPPISAAAFLTHATHFFGLRPGLHLLCYTVLCFLLLLAWLGILLLGARFWLRKP